MTLTNAAPAAGDSAPDGTEPARAILPEFGVVVLNYNDYRSTLACVRSLLNCNPGPREIVVVDNRSSNESFEILQRELAGVERVSVRDSGRNGGYSFGNNVGIEKLRGSGVLHVVIATSDTRVLTPTLFARMQAEIDSTTGAIAPQIQAPGGLQNPSVAKLNFKYLFDLWWVQRGMPGLSLRRCLRRWYVQLFNRNSAESKRAPATPVLHRKVRDVYKLHGAFICLTAAFLDRFEGLDDRIFLFGEEDLLGWQCLRSGLKQRLVEDALVHHDDDSSIKLTWGDEASEFVDREHRKSGRVLRKEISVLALASAWARRIS